MPDSDGFLTDIMVGDLADKIKREREDRRIVRMAEDFGLRLACEGYISQCNIIISEILHHSPDSLNFLVKRALEMLWHTVGPRPATPYALPREAELAEMEQEQRYYDLRERKADVITTLAHVPFDELSADQLCSLARALAAVRHLSERRLISSTDLGGGAKALSYDEGPVTMPSEAEERRGIQVFKNYVSRLGEDVSQIDRNLCSTYANLALKYGWEEEGKQWLALVLRELAKANLDWIGLSSLASGRYCSVCFGEGALRGITGTTPEAASNAAETIKDALRQRWEQGEVKPFASLSWPDLLQRIGEATVKISKDGNEEDSTYYLREPASENAIAAAEARIGLTLPDDYKAFLRFTNGNGCAPHSYGEPPLARVEEIRWDEEMPQVCMLKVEPLPRIYGKEWSELPVLKRVLQISVEGWEEYVYLIEPNMVARLPECRNAAAENKWMTSTWAAWRADHTPYETFRDYMERLLMTE